MGGIVTVGGPDPAAIRLEVLSRMLAGREGWTRRQDTWCLGPFELIARRGPGLSYELWRKKRCVAALMVPRDAIAVCECLAAAADGRASPPQTLFQGLSLPPKNRPR